MKKKSVHDMLRILVDVESANLHKDRLSGVIEDTYFAVDELNNNYWGELSDEDLGYVAAAQKKEDAEEWEFPFGGKDK